MPALTDKLPQIKPGDRVIWLYSRKRSFMLGYGVQRVRAEVIRICKRRIRLKINRQGAEKLVNVHPDSVICAEDAE